MIKKTFSILLKNPKILLLYLLAFTIPMLGYYPLIRYMFIEMIPMMQGSDPQLVTEFWIMYFAVMGVSMLLSLTMIFLFTPPVLNYIYDICEGRDTKGWYKRGLKRSWWKVFVYLLIAYVCAVPVIGVGIVLTFIPFGGIVLYMISLLAWITFVMIGLASIIVEDDFGVGLANIFKIGSKYFFKQLGVLVFSYIPILVASVLMGVLVGIQTYNSSDIISADQFFFDQFVNNIFIMIIVFGLLTAVSLSFIITYSILRYISEKKALAESAETGESTTPAENAELDASAESTEDTETSLIQEEATDSTTTE